MNKFTYIELYKFYLYIQKYGNISTFCNYKNFYKPFIIRHDIDISIEQAHFISKIEEQLGIKTTYLFMVSSNFYNCNSGINKKYIKEMDNSGFEIGLHFHPTGNNLYYNFNKEKDILSNIIGHEIQTVSIHQPSIHNKYPIFNGYNNTYSEEFFEDERYLSDSRMTFRGKDPYKFIRNNKKWPAQILLHPINFSNSGYALPYNYYEVISKYIKNIGQEIKVGNIMEHFDESDMLKHVRKNIHLL